MPKHVLWLRGAIYLWVHFHDKGNTLMLLGAYTAKTPQVHVCWTQLVFAVPFWQQKNKIALALVVASSEIWPDSGPILQTAGMNYQKTIF